MVVLLLTTNNTAGLPIYIPAKGIFLEKDKSWKGFLKLLLKSKLLGYKVSYQDNAYGGMVLVCWLCLRQPQLALAFLFRSGEKAFVGGSVSGSGLVG